MDLKFQSPYDPIRTGLYQIRHCSNTKYLDYIFIIASINKGSFFDMYILTSKIFD